MTPDPSSSSGSSSYTCERLRQRRVDLEVRVLGGRADQGDEPLLDRRQERVLLRLVEAVDLVEEEDRARPLRRRAGRGRGRSPRARQPPSRHRRQLLELRARLLGHDARQRRLACSRRAVQDHRADAVGLDRQRSAEWAPRTCRCPTKSSSVRGRSRKASGATSGSRSRAASANRSLIPGKYAPDHGHDRCAARTERQCRLSVRQRHGAFGRVLPRTAGIPLEGDDDWREARLGGTRASLSTTRTKESASLLRTIHLNLEVEDVDEAISRLRAAGVDVEETMREDWGAAVRVRDPDGYELYLFQPPR